MRATNIQPPLGTPLNASHPLAKGLVACWLLNEGGGQKIYNRSGFKNTLGTLANGAVFKQTARGSALSCDGTNDYASFTTLSSYLNITSSCSFSWWINISAQPGANVWYRMIDHYGGAIAAGSPYSYYMGYVDVSGVKKLSFNYGTSGGFNINYTLTVGQWHHLTYVHNDGTDVDSCYVNGVLVGTATSQTQNPASKLTSPLFLMSEDGSGKYVNGFMQDVKIYNRALSGAEVQQLYTSPYCMFNH